jgi:hypothetical protein
LSIYRVHFKWKGKDVVLCAKCLDLTHPYFVSIKDLFFPSGSSVIINPSEDDLKRAFGEVSHLMIPFQTVTLIEELPEAERMRVMPFSLAERRSLVTTDEELEADPAPASQAEPDEAENEGRTW